MEKPKDLTPADVNAYVLYVDTKHDEVVQLARQMGMLPVTHIQEVQKLRVRPPWLTQVPTLVHTETKTGYRGEAMYAHIRAYVVPASHRGFVSGSQKRRQMWEADTKRATETEFDTRNAPIHVRT